ncbi:DUF2514 family protein [Burkholderia dolosa]|nr:DUF2514 family protein [Burkholderia dolosa]
MACRRFGRSPATGDAVDLLADVLGRTREAAGELAKIAGDRGSAAQQCERSYHALIAMAPINSRALSETGQSRRLEIPWCTITPGIILEWRVLAVSTWIKAGA